MPVTTSTAVMVQRLSGMLDTSDLKEHEQDFVRKLEGMLQRDASSLTRLSEKQLDWLADLHKRHFA